MARTIKVNPAQLTSTAAQVDCASGEYRKLYNKLYTDVGAHERAAWQGVDNQTFTTQIEGFRRTSRMMAKLMDEYSTFLKPPPRPTSRPRTNRQRRPRLTN